MYDHLADILHHELIALRHEIAHNLPIQMFDKLDIIFTNNCYMWCSRQL